jgi:hypothetical protein
LANLRRRAGFQLALFGSLPKRLQRNRTPLSSKMSSASCQPKVNEFQKQQKRIAELETTVARLAATVKEQAAQIEKVSAQLELRKPAERVVANKE